MNRPAIPPSRINTAKSRYGVMIRIDAEHETPDMIVMVEDVVYAW